MALHKDRVVRRATLASKIAGAKSRKRTYRRDLRGRFSGLVEAKGTGGGGLSREGRRATAKVSPSTAVSKRLHSIAKKGRRMR